MGKQKHPWSDKGRGWVKKKKKIRKSSCEGKVAHATYHDAYGVIKTMLAVDMRVYKCKFCHKYHIGHRSYHVK